MSINPKIILLKEIANYDNFEKFTNKFCQNAWEA